jgi:hypothetical protein
MRHALVVVIAICVAAATAAAGHRFGKQVRYAGIHPIPKGEGGGICYIEAPHVHIYAANKLEYRDHGDDHVFVGDPVAYGWDGPKHAYKGHHPIHVEAVVGGDPDVEYCYIDGPHYHYFEPEGPDFKVVGDAAFYVGEPPKVYVDARPAYVGINAYYRPMTYERPVVTVDAPVGWIGARVDVGAPGVVVETPGVVVETPGVVVAPGAVVVDHRGRGTVVGPGVGVSVGAEVHIPVPSVHIGVDVGGPGVIVDERVKVRGGEHHDNGNHRGHHR